MKPASLPPPPPIVSAFQGRTVLCVQECARWLDVTNQHVIDLIETGQLTGINVGGDRSGPSVRVPRTLFSEIARRLGCTEQEMREWVARQRAAAPRARSNWRVPAEGFLAFVQSRASDRLGELPGRPAATAANASQPRR